MKLLWEELKRIATGGNGRKLVAAVIAAFIRHAVAGCTAAGCMIAAVIGYSHWLGLSAHDLVEMPAVAARTAKTVDLVDARVKLVELEIAAARVQEADALRHLTREDRDRLALLPEIRDELRIIRGLQINDSWQRRHE